MHGRHFGDPGCGSNVCDALKRCVRKPGQDVGEVIAHWDFKASAAFDHGDYGGYTRSGRFAPDVDPVAAAKGDRPHGVFRQVVTELQFGMIEGIRLSNALCSCAAFSGALDL